ncbi:MAG: hypothetical protein KDA61_07160, partial [Planctomycetales bacterium]|nr:hypothetical protein [Planctomycetales bacterium]
FRAHVFLEGTDQFGNAWPPLQGEIYRIAETADPQTSLFEVEIRLSNAQRLLRPGMVATARIVTQRLPGYRLPIESVIFRQKEAYAFTVVAEPAEMEMAYWSLGPASLYRAKRVDLTRWVDQGAEVIVPASDANLNNVVVRGQHRLADRQLVRPVVETADPSSTESKAADGEGSDEDANVGLPALTGARP